MGSIPKSYEAQLYSCYPEGIVDQLTAEPERAISPFMRRGTTPFVRVEGISDNPGDNPTILYVPGFGEDIVNKTSFAAQLAVDGANVILPGQNRRGMRKGPHGEREPTTAQAYNYLAVLESARQNDETVHIATHSYGSLVFQKMVDLRPDLFEDSHVFMLAPSGSIEDETLPSLFKSWIAFMKSEATDKRPMEFPDPKNATGLASLKTLLRNPHRTALEVRALKNEKIDYGILIQKVGSLSVMTYAEDAMYAQNRITPMLLDAMDSGVGWSVPVNSQAVVDKELSYGGQGATHDDEQFNPRRVSGALLQILMQRRNETEQIVA